VRLSALPRFGTDGERGSSTIEFLAVTVLMLVPAVYLVLTLAQVQAAAFAAEGAAREAGRHLAQADSFQDGMATATRAVELAFDDQGIEVDGARALAVECSQDPCLSPGAHVAVEVATDVDLPLVPDIVRDVVPAAVPVSAAHVVAVPQFRETA